MTTELATRLTTEMATLVGLRPGTGGLAVLLGVLSAACFTASNALQHRAAGTVPRSTRAPLAVLAHLAKQPAWVVATGISFCAMLLHACALRLGSIVLVQPLMLLGVVAAVLLRSALAHTAPRWCEVRAVGLTTLSLAAFVLSASPRTSRDEPSFVAVGAVVLTCFALGLSALRGSRARLACTPARRAGMLGLGAGVMFGATAGLLKIVGSLVTGGSNPLCLLGAIGALVAAGLLGTAMNQRAYQIAPISYSMPLVNVVDIIVAVAFGALVLGELPGHSVMLVTAQLTALASVGLGLRLISSLGSDRADAQPGGPGSVTVGTAHGSGAGVGPAGRLSDVNVCRAIVGAGAAPRASR